MNNDEALARKVFETLSGTHLLITVFICQKYDPWRFYTEDGPGRDERRLCLLCGGYSGRGSGSGTTVREGLKCKNTGAASSRKHWLATGRYPDLERLLVEERKKAGIS